MITRSPRSVLAVAAALLIGVLAAFAAALVDADRGERGDAQRRFLDRAKVSAALTGSLFTSTTTTSAQRVADAFGARDVGRPALDRYVEDNRSAFAVVVDAHGAPLAASSSTPAPALRHIAAGPPEVTQTLAGRPFGLSGVLDDSGAVIYVVPFAAADGSRRAFVSGVSPRLLSQFLAGYLADIPGAERADAYVLDAAGRVVGSPVEGQAPGEPVREPALLAALERRRSGFGTFSSESGERGFAAAPVAGTPWRVVLSLPTSELYAAVGSALEWLILAVLAGVGLVTLLLLRRSIAAAVALQTAYARLARTNADLEHSNVELKRSNAELEQFASVASHDLQEPLRKVQSFGDHLERRFGDQLPDEANDHLRRMRNAAGRMSTLIEDLLRFSRVTTHARPPQVVDLEAVAQEVTSDLAALVHDAGGTVEVGALPTLEADRLQMRQLLQNLIANALKFRRPGVAPVVTVAARPGAELGSVRFAVGDNGIGFEPEYAERIFRVFERLHPRDVYAGTGIGLALCRKIVERHGGTITAHGRPGEGAEFVVTMPVAQPVPAAPAVELATMAATEERQPAHV